MKSELNKGNFTFNTISASWATARSCSWNGIFHLSSEGSIKLPWVSFGKPSALLPYHFHSKMGTRSWSKTDFAAEPRCQECSLIHYSGAWQWQRSTHLWGVEKSNHLLLPISCSNSLNPEPTTVPKCICAMGTVVDMLNSQLLRIIESSSSFFYRHRKQAPERLNNFSKI